MREERKRGRRVLMYLISPFCSVTAGNEKKKKRRMGMGMGMGM